MAMINSQHINNCQSCSLCKNGVRVVHSVLPDSAKMLIIGEAPSSNDLQSGPISGLAGQMLGEALEQSGLARDRVAMTNMCCCKPANGKKPSKDDIKSCFQYLEKEIELLKPEIIVLLGNTPVSTFLPNLGTITKMRGRRFESQKYNCALFATWSPSAIQYDATKKPQFFSDMRNAVNLLKSGNVIQQTQPRSYYTIESRLQFDWLIKNLNEQPEWAFDCETTGTDFLKDTVFIMTFSWEERTAVLLDLRNDFCVQNNEYVWAQIKSVMENEQKKIMQNGSFDIKMLMQYDIKVRGFYADTLLMSYLLDENTAHNLGALAWEYTDVGGYETELEQYVNTLKIAKKKEKDDKKKELKDKIKDLKDKKSEGEDKLQKLKDEFYSIDETTDDANKAYVLESQEQNSLDELNSIEEELEEDEVSINDSQDLLARLLVKEKIQISYSDIPNNLIYPYSSCDADVTFRAYKAMLPLIQQDGLEFTLFDIMMPAQIMLIMTEVWGVRVDKQHLENLQKSYGEKIVDLRNSLNSDPSVIGFINSQNAQKRSEYLIKYGENEKLRKRYPRFEGYFESISAKKKFLVFNPKSPVQLRNFLFVYLGLPVIDFTKGKDKKPTTTPSTNSAVLEQLSERNDACNIISTTRKLMQLKSTFVDGLLNHIDFNDRIHTQYFLTGTKTGRPSSRVPNLNNIPRKATATDIKNTFIAEEGCYLLELDGKAMEFRVWASMSQDERMIRDIEFGLDIHKVMAGVVYYNRILPSKDDITPEMFADLTKDVTKEQRQDAKTEVVFGPIYGRTAPAIAKSLNIPLREAERVLESIRKRYRKGFGFLNKLHLDCRRDGYVSCIHGRRRHIPELKLRNDIGLERQSKNSPVQGSASDLTLMAGVRILSKLWQQKIPVKLNLTVYDSLVFNTPKEHLKYVIQIAFQEFDLPLPELHVKIEAEAKIGKRWGDMVEIDNKKDLDEQLIGIFEKFELVEMADKL
ncbi:MAG: DNA polymerase [Candidatus Omnitrophica bacterium]|nr:DNA polymerase [Candidatus Omnitrophota bacterium]